MEPDIIKKKQDVLRKNIELEKRSIILGLLSNDATERLFAMDTLHKRSQDDSNWNQIEKIICGHLKKIDLFMDFYNHPALETLKKKYLAPRRAIRFELYPYDKLIMKQDLLGINNEETRKVRTYPLQELIKISCASEIAKSRRALNELIKSINFKPLVFEEESIAL